MEHPEEHVVRRTFEGLIPHSFQPSFFPKTGRLPWVSGGFPERSGSLERMEMESTPRSTVRTVQASVSVVKTLEGGRWKTIR